MRVTVTPICKHPDGWTDSGTPETGERLAVSEDLVLLDHVPAMRRGLRSEGLPPGHPWLDRNGQAWTSFRVEVEP